MILYPRAFSGIGLLLTCAGSALPRALVPAMISTMISIILEVIATNDSRIKFYTLFMSPYPYQAFATMVAFALTFRTNVAYNRYWEGITAFKLFTAKWGDCGTFALSFDCHTDAQKPEAGATQGLFKALVVHRFSLLHAAACAHLRREVELRLASRSAPATPIDLNWSRTQLQRQKRKGLGSDSMRQWCQLMCNCCNFWAACRHSSQRYSDYLDRSPLPVMGGVSDLECSFLSRLDSEARVNAVYAQVLGMLHARRAAGGVSVDAPILSRIHQEMSAGMEGFQQACKLEDTPFPFPYAQVVSLVLMLFALTFPLLAVSEAAGTDPDSSERAKWLPPMLTFMTVLTYYGFHEVARELEDPYLHPPNQLPIVSIHETFNTRLAASWEALDVLYSDQPDTQAARGGLNGVKDTPAQLLLTAWEQRDDGLQTANINDSVTDSTYAMSLEGAAPPPLENSGPRSARSPDKRAFKGPGPGPSSRTAARAQRLSVQLTNIN